jgi:hypothetical protein
MKTDMMIEKSEMPLDSILSGGTGKLWTNSYCKPPSGFQHLGSEYDWLYFFWGLYSAGTNAFSVKEIAEVWDNATSNGQKAYCVPRTLDGETGWTCNTFRWSLQVGPPHGPRTKRLHSNEYRMGSRWSHVRDSARENFGTDMGELFLQTGTRAKVTYSY